MMRLLLALGAIFVGGVAVSGCGSAVPGDAVAVVAGNPIPTRSLQHWGYIAAVGQSQSAPGSPVIVPDPPNYTKCIASLKKVAPAGITLAVIKNACVQQFMTTMEYLVRADWVQGQAAAQGIRVTPAQVQAKFATARAQSPYKTAAEFATLLSTSGQTENDILYRIRIQLLASKLATPAAVAAYYKSHLSSYTTPERRNVRIVLTKTVAQANAAMKALASKQSWAAVAKKYSIDTATKNTGGLLVGVINGQEPSALNSAIFSAPRLKLLGPIQSPFGYYVAQVTTVFPRSSESLAQATSTIKSTLANAALQAPPWEKKWKAKTTCRAGFEIPDCGNYKAPKVATTTTPQTSTPTTTLPSTTPTPTPTTGSTTTKKK